MNMALKPFNIIILAHHSLLSGGIASKLSEYKETLSVHTMDWSAPDIYQRLQNESPDVIILDAGDSNICQKTPIPQLLAAVPNAKIIRLGLESDQVTVFSSIERKVDHATDLVQLIQTFQDMA